MRAICWTTVVVVAAWVEMGCDKKPTPTPAPSVVPSEAPVETDEDPPVRPRPQQVDHELTEARRARIEAKIPEARGFLVASEIERELWQDQEVDREEVALEKLDARAKDKWVLFVGPMLELDADGYVMTLTYHPGSKRDKMKVTPTWLRVEITDIRGYSSILTREGMETAVLAKYRGKGKATPAHDLIGRSLW
jgi:hypothetical protein